MTIEEDTRMFNKLRREAKARRASRQSRSEALLGKIRTAWLHYNSLNAEYEYSLSEGGESDVTRDQVEHAWEDLHNLIMPNVTHEPLPKAARGNDS